MYRDARIERKTMIHSEATVNDPTGLHARPAALLVNAAKNFKSKISIGFGGKDADARSIMGIMSLGIKAESKITITADGDDESDAVARLKSLVESNFTEG